MRIMRTRKIILFLSALTSTAVGYAGSSGRSAQAANVVDIMATSTPITKIGCEQLGSLSFEFDPGSTLIAGDWWFVDLPWE